MNYSQNLTGKIGRSILFVIICLVFVVQPSISQELSASDTKVKEIAIKCRKEVVKEFNTLLISNTLNQGKLFDTFYIPIPNTNPQKYKTQYDKYTDEVLRLILDQYLKKNPKFLFVIAVDKNGYLPTHNSKYSRPITGNIDYDTKNNRTKRIFNDRTGLAAARNQKPYLLQIYQRDTGETLADLSVPIFIKDKHWGAIRIGYKK